jgi:hypothetical protein
VTAAAPLMMAQQGRNRRRDTMHITDTEIEALREEAAAAGDLLMSCAASIALGDVPVSDEEWSALLRWREENDGAEGPERPSEAWEWCRQAIKYARDAAANYAVQYLSREGVDLRDRAAVIETTRPSTGATADRSGWKRFGEGDYRREGEILTRRKDGGWDRVRVTFRVRKINPRWWGKTGPVWWGLEITGSPPEYTEFCRADDWHASTKRDLVQSIPAEVRYKYVGSIGWCSDTEV